MCSINYGCALLLLLRGVEEGENRFSVRFGMRPNQLNSEEGGLSVLCRPTRVWSERKPRRERGREGREKEIIDAHRRGARHAKQGHPASEMNAAGEAERVSATLEQTAGRVSDHRRISLSSGPSKNPAPPPRSQESQAFLLRALCVAAAALVCELLAVRWRRNASLRSSMRLLGLLLLCCLLLLLTCKGAAEEKLAAKVHRKLCEKLDDSFKGCRSAVKGVWIRVGIATEVGFGLTVSPPPSPAAAAAAAALPGMDGSSGVGAAAATAAAAAAAASATCAASKTPADHLLAVRGSAVLCSLLCERDHIAVRAITQISEKLSRYFS